MKYNGIKVKTGQHRIQLEASETDGGERNCMGGRRGEEVFLRKEEVGVDWFWEQREISSGLEANQMLEKVPHKVKVEVTVPCEEKSLVRSVHEV